MSANVVGAPRAKRPNDIPRNYPCVACGKQKSARKRLTRCTECSHARLLDRGRRARQAIAARVQKREQDHQIWLNVRARMRGDKISATLKARQHAHGKLTPYDEMTLKVEAETGTNSKTWKMIDTRWDRVTYLTRAYLGIPHNAQRNPRGMNGEKSAA